MLDSLKRKPALIADVVAQNLGWLFLPFPAIFDPRSKNKQKRAPSAWVFSRKKDHLPGHITKPFRRLFDSWQILKGNTRDAVGRW